MLEAPKGAGNPHTRGGGCDVETGGDFLVGQLVDDSHHERITLGRRQSVELTLHRKPRRETLLDLDEPILGGQVERQAKTLASTRLDLIPPNGIRQDVAGDPEQATAAPSRHGRRENDRCSEEPAQTSRR